MPRTLRWGILGTGNIAQQFVAGIQMLSRNDTIAVGSRRQRTASCFAAQQHLDVSRGNYTEVVEHPRVQAIYVALPNALRSGKHVLCEKPIAASCAEAEEMFDTAKRKGRILAEAFMYRSHPLIQRVQRHVAEGSIGKIMALRTSFCFATRRTRGNVRFNAALADGALIDVGCYCVNFSRLFARSEPSSITATSRLHRNGVNIFTATTMRFPNGIVASFTCGMDAHADNTAMLSRSDGYIEIPVPWKPPQVRSEYIVARMASPRQDGTHHRAGPKHTRHYAAARCSRWKPMTLPSPYSMAHHRSSAAEMHWATYRSWMKSAKQQGCRTRPSGK